MKDKLFARIHSLAQQMKDAHTEEKLDTLTYNSMAIELTRIAEMCKEITSETNKENL